MDRMDTLIRVQCAHCGVKINAKPELAGQTRKCPKCGEPLVIPRLAEGGSAHPSVVPGSAPATGAEAPTAVPPDEGSTPASPPTGPSAPGMPAADAGPAETSPPPLPRRLNRQHRYLIIDKSRVIAHWEANGQGWMVKTGSGFVGAARAREQLAVHGEFRLIELKIVPGEPSRRLAGLASYKLVTRWPLANLDKGDDKICEAIAGRSPLTRDQKNVVRQGLRDYLSRPIWADAQQVLDYLGNADFHSTGVG